MSVGHRPSGTQDGTCLERAPPGRRAATAMKPFGATTKPAARWERVVGLPGASSSSTSSVG
ncbi:hypothetical protein ACFPK5_25090 [Streptomyces beijiangensis]|uniref:hypothetical protein n=1 Tax=Streptomyces beijiangensis TaxID=163361 RepID=UPI003609B01B